MTTTYITTSIPYVNSAPHLGHALEFVIADCLARYHRLCGDHVRFCTGTDENSIKSAQAAAERGVPTAALVSELSAAFSRTLETLHISHDDFIRTSCDPRHLEGVAEIWRRVRAGGDLHRCTYEGQYCNGCERFVPESEQTEGGGCPWHAAPLNPVREPNYFFRLRRYQGYIETLLDSNELRVLPASRRNEALALVRGGLDDFSVSRSIERARGWGLPVPDDPAEFLYVWFDALGNYITALQFHQGGPLFHKYWRDSDRRIHVIGKDILRFHAVFWPAILRAIGEPAPTELLVHGFITVDGHKLSKSAGHEVDPDALCQAYGVDAVRYFLLRGVRTTADGDYTEVRLRALRDADLAKSLGNLANRLSHLIVRHFDGVCPPAGQTSGAVDDALRDCVERAAGACREAIIARRLDTALAEVLRLVAEINQYLNAREPWRLIKTERAAAAAVLFHAAAALRVVAALLLPFLPHTGQRLHGILGVPVDAVWPERDWWLLGAAVAGSRVSAGEILFPK